MNKRAKYEKKVLEKTREDLALRIERMTYQAKYDYCLAEAKIKSLKARKCSENCEVAIKEHDAKKRSWLGAIIFCYAYYICSFIVIAANCFKQVMPLSSSFVLTVGSVMMIIYASNGLRAINKRDRILARGLLLLKQGEIYTATVDKIKPFLEKPQSTDAGTDK